VTEDDVLQVLPTQTVAVPLATPPEDVLVAEIITEEPFVRETTFSKPVLLTVTALGSELFQVVPDDAVRFFVLPSSNVPFAVS
jgi:hypothetical protein